MSALLKTNLSCFYYTILGNEMQKIADLPLERGRTFFHPRALAKDRFDIVFRFPMFYRIPTFKGFFTSFQNGHNSHKVFFLFVILER